jgi:hypothetical protein
LRGKLADGAHDIRAKRVCERVIGEAPAVTKGGAAERELPPD